MKIKVILGSLFILAILIVALAQFYHSMEAPVWAEDDQAVTIAYQKTILAKAVKVDSFIGDQSYKIIFGEDAIGQPIIVWVSAAEIHTEYTADGITEKALRAKFKLKEPTAKLMRIVPGKLQNEFVWELYYKKADANGQQHYYYDYNKFSDGSLLDTYSLGNGKYGI